VTPAARNIINGSVIWILSIAVTAGGIVAMVKTNSSRLDKSEATDQRHDKTLYTMEGQLDGIDKNVERILHHLER